MNPITSTLESRLSGLSTPVTVVLPGGHFEAYTTAFDDAGGAARDWLVQHLLG